MKQHTEHPVAWRYGRAGRPNDHWTLVGFDPTEEFGHMKGFRCHPLYLHPKDTLENATNLVLHAWHQGWDAEETAKVLKLAGVKRKGILTALEHARAIIKADK